MDSDGSAPPPHFLRIRESGVPPDSSRKIKIKKRKDGDYYSRRMRFGTENSARRCRTLSGHGIPHCVLSPCDSSSAQVVAPSRAIRVDEAAGAACSAPFFLLFLELDAARWGTAPDTGCPPWPGGATTKREKRRLLWTDGPPAGLAEREAGGVR